MFKKTRDYLKISRSNSEKALAKVLNSMLNQDNEAELSKRAAECLLSMIKDYEHIILSEYGFDLGGEAAYFRLGNNFFYLRKSFWSSRRGIVPVYMNLCNIYKINDDDYYDNVFLVVKMVVKEVLKKKKSKKALRRLKKVVNFCIDLNNHKLNKRLFKKLKKLKKKIDKNHKYYKSICDLLSKVKACL